jgi:tetratricopeptide (TPR) repeat protein
MPQRISQCSIWKLQEDYYRNLGMAAWDNRTPYFLTNSQVVADNYASLILATLLDRPADLSQPVYIVELGSGTGRLAYNLIRELERKRRYFPATQKVRFQVVLSDIAEETVQFWETHPRFHDVSFWVDFALWSPFSSEPLRLRKSGKVLENARNPVFVLANYFFDSLPHDEFFIRAGQLEERLVDVVPKAVPSYSSANRLDVRDVDLQYSYRPADATTYYQDPVCSALLQGYVGAVASGAVTVPVASLACIARLRSLGTLCLLSSDRGFTTLPALTAYPDHPWALHSGCFSHMVNFDALGRAFHKYLHTTHHTVDGVQTVFCSDLEVELPHVEYEFRERVDRGNPANSAVALFSMAREEPKLAALLGVVKLNLYDPNALSMVGLKLAPMLKGITYGEHLDVVAALEECWRNDYYFRGSANVTFWLGHLYQTLGLFDRALWFFTQTIERVGADAMLWYLSGGCHESMGNRSEAVACYKRALALETGMAEATEALRSLGEPLPA